VDAEHRGGGEDVAHAWYEGTGKPEHPYEGTTIPKYTGLNKKDDGYAYLKTDEKYSWIKAGLYKWREDGGLDL